jgi:hypothetical protein
MFERMTHKQIIAYEFTLNKVSSMIMIPYLPFCSISWLIGEPLKKRISVPKEGTNGLFDVIFCLLTFGRILVYDKVQENKKILENRRCQQEETAHKIQKSHIPHRLKQRKTSQRQPVVIGEESPLPVPDSTPPHILELETTSIVKQTAKDTEKSSTEGQATPNDVKAQEEPPVAKLQTDFKAEEETQSISPRFESFEMI